MFKKFNFEFISLKVCFLSILFFLLLFNFMFVDKLIEDLFNYKSFFLFIKKSE